MRLLRPATRLRVVAVFFASAVTASPLLGATLPSGFQETILASGLAEARRPSPSRPTDASSCV